MNSIYSSGEIINNYQLLRLIGVGGFGEVWLAQHLDLGGRFAVKIPTLAPYVKQLRAEGRIQHDLEHPNIVRILDLNTAHDPPYCVMEYIDGENLRRRLIRQGSLLLPEALDIIRQILLALHEAHGQGIVHRDLKPENVLLDSRDGAARVTDFGLGGVVDEVSRSILRSGERTRYGKTATGERTATPTDSDHPDTASIDSIQRSDSGKEEEYPAVTGTYDYMSPEQRSGEKVDARSDLYAAGVILFEMLTGARPSGDIEKPLKEPGHEAHLVEAILTALDEYEYRHASAAAFLHALHLDSVLRRPAPALPATSSAAAALRDYLKTLSVRMKPLSGGGFLMGSNDGAENERPSHHADVEPFYLGLYPVTASEYALFLNENGDPDGQFIRLAKQSTIERVVNGYRALSGAENYPVNFVSWHGASAFCQWLSRLTGQDYSLPSEAEWEYAARCGAMTNDYPWGSKPPTPEQANFGKIWRSSVETLCPVDAKPPNADGFYGMAGNVWEWCLEPFLGDWAKTRHALATGVVDGKQHNYHVVRGGCWSSPPEELRCSRRDVQSKGCRSAAIGFRLARKP